MTWFNNDREESKPSWLNKAQKRNCVRTIRGWEVPSANSFGNQFDGWKTNGPTAYIPTLELIVAMPTDITGGAVGDRVGPNFFIRGTTGAYGNGYGGAGVFYGGTGASQGNAGFVAESGRDVPNYSPYFTCPFNADTCTAGGPFGVGVSHNGSYGSGLMADKNYAYKVNKYGVSSLGMPYGVTAYIKVCVNDFNFTQNISMTAANVAAPGGGTGFSLFIGGDLLDTTKVPLAVYEEFFGATSAVNNNIAVIRFTSSQATAGGPNSQLTNREIAIGLTAWDNSGATIGGFTSGATAAGVVFKVRFDRANPYG